jgi:hypothetical protein
LFQRLFSMTTVIEFMLPLDFFIKGLLSLSQLKKRNIERIIFNMW